MRPQPIKYAAGRVPWATASRVLTTFEKPVFSYTPGAGKLLKAGTVTPYVQAKRRGR